MDGVIKFSDIIKKSFMEDIADGNLTLTRVILTLAVTFAIALFIGYIYKRTFIGVIFSRSFSLSLILIALVTALIIMPITSNLALSLGMVGALSIVRFRTAVKDAYDTGFMFWSIAVGISLGAGFYIPTALGSFIIGILMLLLNSSKHAGPSSYLFIIHHTLEASEAIRDELLRLPSHKLKSQAASQAGVELIIELKLRGDNISFIKDFLKIQGVQDASLVNHQGDFLK